MVPSTAEKSATHPVLAFYLLAYAFSWSIAIPLALQAQGVTRTAWPLWLHYLTGLGPMFAAFVVSRVTRQPGVARPIKAPPRRLVWIAVGAACPLAIFLFGRALGGALGQPTPGWTDLGRVNFLPPLGIAAWLLRVATNGFGEEVGWRGFALPRLETNHSALASTMLLTTAWAGWHAPMFFYVPSFRAIAPVMLPGFFLGLLSGAIVLTWLYNKSGHSVIPVALWHGSFNFVTGSPTAAGFSAATTSALVIVWAVFILFYYRAGTLMAPRLRSIRAKADERARRLPSDDLVSDPIGSMTHAVTIRRLPCDVWPWLAQMGADRAGWYSYDMIDNGGARSAERLRPDLQRLEVGMTISALPGRSDGFVVAGFDPGRFLTLGWRVPGGSYLMTWTFALEEHQPGTTRLIVRVRAGRGYRLFGLPASLGTVLARVVHFIMERKRLLGIARRAEAHG